jgi:hypothetical protein
MSGEGWLKCSNTLDSGLPALGCLPEATAAEETGDRQRGGYADSTLNRTVKGEWPRHKGKLASPRYFSSPVHKPTRCLLRGMVLNSWL